MDEMVSFADYYKLGGLSPSPDIIERRQAALKKLKSDLSADRILSSVRLYYGLEGGVSANWLAAAFVASDPSFSLVDNDREVRILAGCLLANAVAQQSATAILALVAASVDGLRAPTVLPNLLSDARRAMGSEAVRLRSSNLDGKPFTERSKADYSAKADAIAGDIAKVPELAKFLGDEAFQGTRHVLVQANGIIPPLVGAVEVLREQVEILWWLIGGYSRLLESPLAAASNGLGPVLAGLDVADLSVRAMAPVAAPVLILRLLGGSSLDAETILQDVVEACPRRELGKLARHKALASVHDFCPVLAAFAHAERIGAAPAWLNAYEGSAKFSPGTAMTGKTLAAQALVEALLLKQLG
jgi:hypothetical protein